MNEVLCVENPAQFLNHGQHSAWLTNWSSMLVPLPCYNHFPTGLLTSSLPFLPYIEDHAISCLRPSAHHCFPITLKTISNQDSRVRPACTRRPCRGWSWVALTAPPQCSLCSGGNFLTLFLFFTFSFWSLLWSHVHGPPPSTVA